jgi:hypothetical protein
MREEEERGAEKKQYAGEIRGRKIKREINKEREKK